MYQVFVNEQFLGKFCIWPFKMYASKEGVVAKIKFIKWQNLDP